MESFLIMGVGTKVIQFMNKQYEKECMAYKFVKSLSFMNMLKHRKQINTYLGNIPL